MRTGPVVEVHRIWGHAGGFDVIGQRSTPHLPGVLTVATVATVAQLRRPRDHCLALQVGGMGRAAEDAAPHLTFCVVRDDARHDPEGQALGLSTAR